MRTSFTPVRCALRRASIGNDIIKTHSKSQPIIIFIITEMDGLVNHLDHSADQAFEIFPFRMAQVDRVVDWVSSPT